VHRRGLSGPGWGACYKRSNCSFDLSELPVTLSKMECLKQRIRIGVHVSMGQRNRTAGSFIVLLLAVMVDRDSWGY
jgi:hypothetical protein